ASARSSPHSPFVRSVHGVRSPHVRSQQKSRREGQGVVSEEPPLIRPPATFSPQAGRRTHGDEHPSRVLLPAARVAIFGIGNVLLGDDGVGPAAARYIETHFDLGDDVIVEDLGTPSLSLP